MGANVGQVSEKSFQDLRIEFDFEVDYILETLADCLMDKLAESDYRFYTDIGSDNPFELDDYWKNHFKKLVKDSFIEAVDESSYESPSIIENVESYDEDGFNEEFGENPVFVKIAPLNSKISDPRFRR